MCAITPTAIASKYFSKDNRPKRCTECGSDHVVVETEVVESAFTQEELGEIEHAHCGDCDALLGSKYLGEFEWDNDEHDYFLFKLRLSYFFCLLIVVFTITVSFITFF